MQNYMAQPAKNRDPITAFIGDEEDSLLEDSLAAPDKEQKKAILIE